MTQDIFIGIDGGASKSNIRIEDLSGQVLGEAISGPANICVSVEQARQSITSGLQQILKPLAIDLNDKQYRFHAGMGLAGCEVPAARESYLNTPHPFASLQLVSDAHTACLGAHAGNEGSIILVGTGVVGYQIRAGETKKIAGWGFPHDDTGGGAWLGLEAVRLTLRWLDKRSSTSPLLQAVYASFANDMTRLVSWANAANSTEFAKLAPLVIRHAQQNDPSAVFLLVKAGAAIDEIGATLELDLPCALAGGLAEFLEPYLSADLRGRLVPCQANAAEGAIIMVREKVLA